jgi:hypothetical protein
MQLVLLNIITILHVLFVLFIVFAPFINSNYILFIHSYTVPFMVLHWILNDDTCILTLIEKYLKKKIYKEHYKEDDSITYKLIGPIYKFIDNNKTFSKLIYISTFIFWTLSFSNLCYKFKNGHISNFRQLFII